MLYKLVAYGLFVIDYFLGYASIISARVSAGRRVTPDTPKVVSGGTASLPSRKAPLGLELFLGLF